MRRRFLTQKKSMDNEFDYLNYFTIECLEDGRIRTINTDILYGVDGKGWGVLPSELEVKKGQLISLKSYKEYFEYFSLVNCNIRGNSLSLVFGDASSTNNDLTGKHSVFHNLLVNNPIHQVDPLFLPATTLTDDCYYEMFRGCSSLTTAPELPATTLAYYCYAYMFQGCTSLTVAPELPATALASGCYNSMFMGCSNLNYIKMLATDIPTPDCLYNWVYGVSPTGTFVKRKGVEIPRGVNGIPEGWDVIEI